MTLNLAGTNLPSESYYQVTYTNIGGTVRDVGEMGERDLARWAPQVGIIANKAERDRTGWDFLLELPASSTASASVHLPLDRRPHPVQCLVQVKSTDHHPGRWTVKLDNWKRLVQSPLPAFFLVLEYDGGNECQRGYLVHIDNHKVRQVLAKLRELSVLAPDTPLHRKGLSFIYNESDCMPSLDGNGLLSAIRRFVPDFEQYTESKQCLLREVGYEEGGQSVEARILVPGDGREISFEEKLVEFSLEPVRHFEVEPRSD